MLPGLGGFLPAAAVALSITFCGGFTTGKSTSTSASIDIGAADPTREIFLVTAGTGGANTLTAASTTVNGVAVTKATNEYVGTIGSLYYNMACAFAHVPNGSGSVTVTVTHSGAPGAYVGVYRVTGRKTIGANQNDASTNTAASGTSISLTGTTINAQGLWFGAYVNRLGGNSPYTYPSGTNLDYGSGFVSGNNANIIHSRAVQTSGSTPTDTWTSKSSSTNIAAASWSFD